MLMRNTTGPDSSAGEDWDTLEMVDCHIQAKMK